ncbi:uncharacterized protein [Maniola hyperantus]|uniref:uncharacterized protein n=1 Tax=Aphantopus hyperantus TaxID=2795564 RepID=UPI003747B248
MTKSKHKKTLSSRHMRAIISGRGLRFNDDLGELTVTTWNVRTLHQDGKIENAVREMKRHGWDILGISETRWKENGEISTYGNTHFYFSGGDKHYRGVGFLVNKDIKDCVSGYIPQSERIILLQLNTKPIRTNLIQVYAPTADSTQDECEKFYDDLNLVMKRTKNHDINIIMGDFNAKVGEAPVHNIIGQYGLGERNDRGERLIEFCAEHTLTERNRRKHWITDEIIDLFNKRKESKHNISKYKEVNDVLQKKIKEAKEADLILRCNHIEYLAATHQHGALHKAIKDSPTKPNISISNAVADSKGNIIIELDERLQRWSEYIAELYHDDRPSQTVLKPPLSGHPILSAELDFALQSLKHGKAAGEDGIPVELLLGMGDHSKDIMLQLFHKIYDSEIDINFSRFRDKSLTVLALMLALVQKHELMSI